MIEVRSLLEKFNDDSTDPVALAKTISGGHKATLEKRLTEGSVEQRREAFNLYRELLKQELRFNQRRSVAWRSDEETLVSLLKSEENPELRHDIADTLHDLNKLVTELDSQ